MATITTTGITPKTLEQYRTDLEAVFKQAFGDDLNVEPSTPQGQIIGIVALLLSQADDNLISVASASNIYRAFGQQIDGLASILSVNRSAASRTQVTATLTGVAATIIPAGTRAQSINGDLFSLDSDVQLPGSGTITATMFSVETGPIPLAANELTQIVDVVPGWETVDNSSAGQPGQDVEADSAYRRKYFIELFKNALSVLNSTIGRVRLVEGVTDIIGRENDTNSTVTIQNIDIDANSIALVVEGGSDNEIAQAIYEGKTGGTGTTGTTSVTIQPNGFDQTFRFFRVRTIPLQVDITISIGPNFPGNGQALIKERIQEYINGPFGVNDEGYFETDGINIAETLHKSRLYTPLNSVQGYTISVFEMGIVGGSQDIEQIVPDLDQRVIVNSLDDITITVV